MAKPNKKPPNKTVDIFCRQCNQLLFKYQKGGKGALVKSFKVRIVKDYTQAPCQCPKCEAIFAREQMIKGLPAYKFVGGKVWFK
ncbi:hypothetical protein [Thalassotalea ganghwensis]